MALPNLLMGEKIRLRMRIIPGHCYARLDQRNTSRSDLPAGSVAYIRKTHGTEYQVEVIPETTNMTARGVDVWVQTHMMGVLFEAASADSK